MKIKSFFRKKNIKDILKVANQTEFKRTLDVFQLIMLGIGAIVGAGIFVLTGTAASTSAGPAVVISFIIGSIACSCAALCYAELSSAIPIAGGAYSYAYVTFGEIAAWLVGSMILIGNIFMIASVAVGWAGYFAAFLEYFNLYLPSTLHYQSWTINLLATVVAILSGIILYRGVETSASVNSVIVVIKVVVLVLFILLGAFYIKPDNWSPFVPDYIETTGQFGFRGIFGGAAIVFLAFNGFDTVASAAQETKNPQKNLPIGVIGSLLISAIIYILVSGVLTGLVPYTELNTPQPMALAVKAMGMPWLAIVVTFGAICGLASVELVMIYSVVRITFTMAKDGLLPSFLTKIHHRNKTPHITTLIMTAIISILAATFPLDTMVQLGNYCVILVFITVCFMSIFLRITQPKIERGFLCPFMPWIPLAGIALFTLFLANMPNKEVIFYVLGLLTITSIYYIVRRIIFG
jgi:APA family basic amino acid/polyamine antiporter